MGQQRVRHTVAGLSPDGRSGRMTSTRHRNMAGFLLCVAGEILEKKGRRSMANSISTRHSRMSAERRPRQRQEPCTPYTTRRSFTMVVLLVSSNPGACDTKPMSAPQCRSWGCGLTACINDDTSQRKPANKSVVTMCSAPALQQVQVVPLPVIAPCPLTHQPSTSSQLLHLSSTVFVAELDTDQLPGCYVHLSDCTAALLPTRGLYILSICLAVSCCSLLPIRHQAPSTCHRS